jgi:hypothetical protein
MFIMTRERLTHLTCGCIPARRLARLLLDWSKPAANLKPEIRFTMGLTQEELA